MLAESGGHKTMKKIVLALAICLTVAAFTPFSLAEKTAKKPVAAAGVVDKAHLQKIWDGWSSLDVAGQKQYYAQGAHVFFDIAPLKYASWDEYQAGVVKVLEDYKAARCTVNDDAQIHKSGDGYWITATVACDMTHKSGKRDLATMRWTALFERQDGKWLIIHEHVSEAIQ
jgi:ketosteroid isomerase-like protein